MKIPYFVINAFAQGPFSGNPAGVCLLERWPSAETLLAIARQNNLSETAFVGVRRNHRHIRWFSPRAEVDLCGHATLAAARALFDTGRWRQGPLAFTSRSGLLVVERSSQGLLGLDAPRWPLQKGGPKNLLTQALGRRPEEVWTTTDDVAVYSSEAEVRALRPNLELLKKLKRRAVAATAPGKKSDYVLRLFGPRIGIPEDPATGSIQCALAPFWAKRLNKTTLHVRQLSPQGGEMWCEPQASRVKIWGRTALYLKGFLSITG